MKQTLMTAAVALTFGLSPGATADASKLDMTSIYPSSFPVIGETGKDLGRRINLVTGGELDIVFHEPGALVPAIEARDAVSTGAVDAAWYSPGFTQGIIPSAAMFTSVPFGPEAPEYLA